MSGLHDRREQLDGYQLYAEIAYRFRPKVLPDDRDDIEQDITIKLKREADKKDQVTIGFLYAVAKNVVRTYWRKKYRYGRQGDYACYRYNTQFPNSRHGRQA